MKKIFFFNPFFSVLIIVLFFVSCQQKTFKADLVITNATIWTGNENNPIVQAMAIAGDTILSVGTSKEISRFVGKSTKVKDLKGKFVTPGFIDTHVHLLTGGFNLNSVQLRNAKTPEEFIKRIEEFAKTVPKGSWILGGVPTPGGAAESTFGDLVYPIKWIYILEFHPIVFFVLAVYKQAETP